MSPFVATVCSSERRGSLTAAGCHAEDSARDVVVHVPSLDAVAVGEWRGGTLKSLRRFVGSYKTRSDGCRGYGCAFSLLS
jgi:hypothetical protein